MCHLYRPRIKTHVLNQQPCIALSRDKKKIPKMKSKLLKKALVRVFKGKKKNSAITKKNIKKRMSCSLCPYHTNNSGLLQNHLLQHNAPTS